MPRISSPSFFDVAATRLELLGRAVGFSDARRASCRAVLEDILAPWGHQAVGDVPERPSDITDDHFPIELSVAFTGASPEVRVLFEAQSESPEMLARWHAATALNARLERDHDASLDRLRRIEDLFIPDDRTARWAMWHCVCFDAVKEPTFKVYLNPQARGTCTEPRMTETLRRLGFSRALAGVTSCERRDDELKFFSLDLEDGEAARVKVYKAHHRATRRDIETSLRVARDYRPEAADGFWRDVVGHEGPFLGLPPTTYLSLTSDDDRPSTATLHFPVRAYAPSDRAVKERLSRFLSGADREAYERAITAFATRPLEDAAGMQSYVSFRHHRAAPRITVYLAPEAYSLGRALPSTTYREATREHYH